MERLQEEKNSLSAKIWKLEQFIKSDKFSEVELREQELLVIQLELMRKYYGVLNFRCFRHGSGHWPEMTLEVEK